jgi:DNA-binding response OmpR family regulator
VKILCVDDEPRMLDLLTDLCEALGHETLRASSALGALDLFDREPVRAVITDWMMADMDGIKLIQRIRAAGRQRYTYIIMLTALGGTDRYLEGMRAGADDFVTKPITIEELEARLRVAERIIGLQEHVRLLEGMLSICMYCKRIRVTEDAWTAIEHYVEEHSDASFSHGICPECYEIRVRPQFDQSGEPT